MTNSDTHKISPRPLPFHILSNSLFVNPPAIRWTQQPVSHTYATITFQGNSWEIFGGKNWLPYKFCFHYLCSLSHQRSIFMVIHLQSSWNEVIFTIYMKLQITSHTPLLRTTDVIINAKHKPLATWRHMTGYQNIHALFHDIFHPNSFFSLRTYQALIWSTIMLPSNFAK